MGLLHDKMVTYRGGLLPFADVEFRNSPHSRREWAMPGLLADNARYPSPTLAAAKAAPGVAWDIIKGIPGAVHQTFKGMEKFGGAVMGNNTISPDEITQLALDTGMLSGAASVGSVPAGSLGAHVWHGGPHKYGPEGVRESLKHIGKGEGAQAYGWGRYDAGAREVGEQYQRVVGTGGKGWDGTAAPIESMVSDQVVTKLGEYGLGYNRDNVATAWLNGGPARARQKVAEIKQEMRDFNFPDEEIKAFDDYADALDFDAVQGNLYKLDLPDEDIARYLDWDKPLSEQGEIGQSVIKALKAAEKPSPAQSAADKALLDELAVELADFRGGPDPYEGMTGAQAYSTLQEIMGGRGSVFDKEMPAQKAASEALARAGIPGLKYLDGMSRGAGEGTHNYVTWDQDVLNRMKMLERNGEALGANASPVPGLLGAQQGNQGLLGSRNDVTPAIARAWIARGGV